MIASAPFVLGLVQMSYPGSPKASMEKAETMLREAARQGVQVVCLPELFLTDYFCQREDQSLFDLAEPVPGPTTQRLAAIAKETKMVIAGSVFEKRAPGIYHNSSMVFDSDGQMIGLYRKMHIPHDPLFFEKYYFTPGDLGWQCMESSRARIGTLICWDQWYPEGARATALLGAELLVYPTAIGWHPREKAEYGAAQQNAWETMQRSHAIANGCFVAAINRHGLEVPSSHLPPQAGGGTDGIEFWGHSFIVDPYGRILACGSDNKDEIVMAEVNPALIEEARRNWPFFRDRRIDAYGTLTQRFGG